MWRFDQGRLDYFQFDEIKNIAAALAELDGIHKPANKLPDVVRDVLSMYTNLPFAPDHYYVWRNYSRVFGCLLLASEVGGRIFATDLCKTIAAAPESIDCDDYLAHFAKNFYYPSPIFQNYSFLVGQNKAFPVVAIVKFLISEFETKQKDYVSVDEIIEKLIGNNVTGLEPFSFYRSLVSRNNAFKDDEKRQLREMVRFVSQFSFLKWDNPNLYLDVKNIEELHSIVVSLEPANRISDVNADIEILNMGRNYEKDIIGKITLHQLESLDEEFTEGKKIRVTHLRAERSNKLKILYFAKEHNPQVCRMCEMDTAVRYPWAGHVIELHHLLPLTSPVRVESGRTSLKDLVGLCPSCHRATHRFYSKWFKENGVRDFSSYEQAVFVYNEARNHIVLI